VRQLIVRVESSLSRAAPSYLLLRHKILASSNSYFLRGLAYPDPVENATLEKKQGEKISLICMHTSPDFSEESPNGFDLTTIQYLREKSLCSWDTEGLRPTADM